MLEWVFWNLIFKMDSIQHKYVHYIHENIYVSSSLCFVWNHSSKYTSFIFWIQTHSNSVQQKYNQLIPCNSFLPLSTSVYSILCRSSPSNCHVDLDSNESVFCCSFKLLLQRKRIFVNANILLDSMVFK